MLDVVSLAPTSTALLLRPRGFVIFSLLHIHIRSRSDRQR